MSAKRKTPAQKGSRTPGSLPKSPRVPDSSSKSVRNQDDKYTYGSQLDADSMTGGPESDFVSIPSKPTFNQSHKSPRANKKASRESGLGSKIVMATNNESNSNAVLNASRELDAMEYVSRYLNFCPNLGSVPYYILCCMILGATLIINMLVIKKDNILL